MLASNWGALVVTNPKEVKIERRVDPLPNDEEILVKPTAVGLCGTDLEIIDGTIDDAYVKYPISIGHEWSATVVYDPSGTFSPETPIVVEGIIPCWSCQRCRAGETNLCHNYNEIGFTRDGGAGAYVLIPFRQAHPIANGLSIEAAVLIEPGSVVYRGLALAKPDPAARVLVVGDGTIALLTAHLMSLWSPAEIVMLGIRTEQAELAHLAGTTKFETNPEATGNGYDLVVEASGSVQAIPHALRAARRGGKVLFLGLPPHGTAVPIAVDDVVNNDLTLIGSFSYTSDIWASVVKLFNTGMFRPEFLITHRFTFDKWESALEILRVGQGPRGKVLLLP